MSAKWAWAELTLRYTECRTKGHLWERAFYGDGIRDHGGTHRCARCRLIGYPPPNDGTGM